MVCQCLIHLRTLYPNTKKIFRKLRSHQRVQFKEDKGSHIASLVLTEDTGVADKPNKKNYGHFTFHEYEDIDLQEKVKDTQKIFKANGEFVD